MNATTGGYAVFATDHPSVIMTLKHWRIPQVEIPFLTIIFLVGMIGNISIIGAIVLEKKLKVRSQSMLESIIYPSM